jgi:hypothetical protein
MSEYVFFICLDNVSRRALCCVSLPDFTSSGRRFHSLEKQHERSNVGQDPGSVSSNDVRNRKEASVVSLDNGIDARRLVLLIYGLFIAASKQFERAASLWLVVIDLSWKT